VTHTLPWSHLLSSTPSFAHPSSTIVGNHSILLVSSVCESILPELFYLNDVLVTSDLIHRLLSVCRFTTNNSCSMKFDPLGLFVKNLATKHGIYWYDSIGLLYTLPLTASCTHIPHVVLYALHSTPYFLYYLTSLFRSPQLRCPLLVV
jgi:hypothetical protein